MGWLTENRTSGWLNAVVKNLGEENAEAVAAGLVTIERVGNTLQLKDKPKASKVATLFNRHGFRIVPRGLKANTTKPNTGYYFTPQPPLSIFSYEERLARLVKHLGVEAFISAQDFADRSTAILKLIEGDETTAKLLKGVALPFVLPQMDFRYSFVGDEPLAAEGESQTADYGQVLDEKFLPAVAASYREQFPNRPFTNHRKGDLANKVTIIKGSRHDKLVEAMKLGCIVGVYFPNCLQGFSVDADREQMSSLPEQFLLAGGFEAASAMIGYPDVLARDGNTPLLDLAAMQWQSSGSSLYFSSGGDDAGFDDGAGLSVARGGCAGGLVVLG
jgi:hypothetical protein